MRHLKLVAIVGPTASGKSAWAIRLAKKFNGIIISADSRQVYRDLDIATAKITKPEMAGVPHYLLSVVRPDEEFNVAIYQTKVRAILNRITKPNQHRSQNTSASNGRCQLTYQEKTVVPFLVGGTGLYVAAITEGYQLPAVSPDPKLRARLETQPLITLVRQLRRLDPSTKVDVKNKRRVVRAIEILRGGGRPAKTLPDFDVLKIGIKMPREKIYANIERRIRHLDWDALIKETKKLMRAGLDFASNPLTAIYYQFVRDYITGRLTKDQTIAKLIRDDKNYAKRQLTWFNRDKHIHWVTTLTEAGRLVKDFLKTSD